MLIMDPERPGGRRNEMGIAVLDAQTVGRIAAGEVVERPSSVAKELIENALDAGATAITVEVRDGGARYLRVTDNGCGIAPGEVRLAFENHATSKIRSGDLLDDLHTMGFRGEALPSIASVAKVTVTTRQKDADFGVRLRVEGGRFGEAEQIGCPEGTTVVVEDLFFNVPARQAFLKKPATEAGVVSDLVQRMILGYPGTAFRYMQNGRLLYHSSGDGNLRHAAFAVYGRSVAERLEVIEGAEGGMRISGLIGTGEMSRPSRSSEYFFINGRSIRCPLLTRTVEEALAGRVLTGQYPMCALSVTIPPASVDVNVHPGKLEVRFKDEYMIRLSLETILARALLPKSAMLEAAPREAVPQVVVTVGTDPDIPTLVSDDKTDRSLIKEAPQAVFGRPESGAGGYLRDVAAPPPGDADVPPDVMAAFRREQERMRQEKEAAKPPVQTPIGSSSFVKMPVFEEKPSLVPVEKPAAMPVEKPRQTEKAPEPEQMSLGEDVLGKEKAFRVIGVFLDAYILVECGKKLIMIDQHAAHERILYERFEREIGKGVAMQELMFPEVFPTTARETAIVADNRQALLDAGYDAEPLGERAVQVRAVPYILGQTVTKPLFLEMIDELDRLRDASMDMRHEVIITASCKHAVKAGEALGEEQIEELVNIMATTDAPPVCAHGRPVLKVWTLAEVERMFKRT